MDDQGPSGQSEATRVAGEDRASARQTFEGDLHVVATVHLDTQWRWTIQRTIREYLPDTFDGNFALFEKYPHYVLSWEGAFRYMLIQEYYPEAWERLKEYVRAERWTVAGNMLESVDVHLISPESLIRQFLYGSRYFEHELGSQATDVFLPDCFGFGFSFPSIAAHCGLTGFSSQKLIKWMTPAKPPFDVGVWEGPDGGSLLAVLNPEGYGDGIVEDLSRAERWRKRIADLGRNTGCYAGYKYFGIGDRGGAPDEASLEWLGKSLDDPGPLRILHGRSDRFFRDIAEHEERLPRHRGELLLPEHGPGCYTSLGSMKRWNRKNEHLADAAERFSAAASWAEALPYPAQALEQGWLRFLWHQMHDDLTGTSIPQAYRFSWNDEAIATNRFCRDTDRFDLGSDRSARHRRRRGAADRRQPAVDRETRPGRSDGSVRRRRTARGSGVRPRRAGVALSMRRRGRVRDQGPLRSQGAADRLRGRRRPSQRLALRLGDRAFGFEQRSRERALSRRDR